MEERDDYYEDPYANWPPEKLGEPFFPHHVIHQLIQILLVFTLLLLLVVISPWSMEPKADPFTTPEHIKPEWYFLASYQFLKFAEKLSFLGKWAPKFIGIFGQGILILLLFLIPFLDRNPERHPLKRPVATGIGICVIIAFIIFTIWGYLS